MQTGIDWQSCVRKEPATLTVYLPWTYIFFVLFFYVLTVLLLKCLGESFLLSEDEPLTPNIDGVMALWIFRRRAQTAKNRRKSAKIGPLDPSFYFFAPTFSGIAFCSYELLHKQNITRQYFDPWLACWAVSNFLRNLRAFFELNAWLLFWSLQTALALHTFELWNLLPPTVRPTIFGWVFLHLCNCYSYHIASCCAYWDPQTFPGAHCCSLGFRFGITFVWLLIFEILVPGMLLAWNSIRVWHLASAWPLHPGIRIA